MDIINDKVTIIRRIGIDENNNLYVLNSEIIEELGEVDLGTFEDNTYVYVKEYGNLKYDCRYIIKNDYIDTFALQKDLDTAVVDLNSNINQTAESINLEVSKKVGNDEIISTINQSAEKVQIKADKISLEGKEINLTGDNTIIKSNNFNVDKNGNMNCNNAKMNNVTINGGQIFIDESGSAGLIKFRIKSPSASTTITSRQIYLGPNFNAGTYGGNEGGFVECTGPGGVSRMTYSGIRSPSIVETSLESEKKNFEKLNNIGLKTIKEIDIYKYNLKLENDTNKKHIGFVIGDNYKYSKEVTSNDNSGVDTYSFISLCCKAIQEQQEIIEKLEKKIKCLEEKLNEKN